MLPLVGQSVLRLKRYVGPKKVGFFSGFGRK